MNNTRIYFDNISKRIILTSIESTQREQEDIQYIDLSNSEFDVATSKIIGIDENNNPIIEQIQETEWQKRIRELEEDVLLLQAENEVGGIL